MQIPNEKRSTFGQRKKQTTLARLRVVLGVGVGADLWWVRCLHGRGKPVVRELSKNGSDFLVFDNVETDPRNFQINFTH